MTSHWIHKTTTNCTFLSVHPTIGNNLPREEWLTLIIEFRLDTENTDTQCINEGLLRIQIVIVTDIIIYNQHIFHITSTYLVGKNNHC